MDIVETIKIIWKFQKNKLKKIMGIKKLKKFKKSEVQKEKKIKQSWNMVSILYREQMEKVSSLNMFHFQTI